MDKHIFLVVISADKAIAISHVEPFDCALDFLCYHFATSFFSITWGFFFFFFVMFFRF